MGPAVFVAAVWICINFLFELNLSALGPINSIFSSFSIKDIYYGKIQSKKELYDDRIVLVDIDTLGRKGILECLQAVDSCKPRAVGIDILFPELKDDITTDLLLAAYAQQHRNSVFAVNKIEDKGLKESFFTKNDSLIKKGLVNFGKEGEHMVVRTLLNKVDSVAFRSMVYQLYTAFAARNSISDRLKNETEIEIFYKRIRFPEIKASALIADPASFKKIINDKIVLVGATNDAGDMHVTPYSTAVPEGNGSAGFTESPGIEIHAMTLSLLLSGVYVRNSVYLDWLFVIVLFLISVYSMVYLLEKDEFYMDLGSKVYAFLFSCLLFLLYMFLFDRFHFQFNFMQAIVIVILTSEMVKIYKPVMAIVFNVLKRVRVSILSLKKMLHA